MTRLYDGKKIAEITMNVWNGNGYTPDFSLDFFEVGALPYDEEKEAYVVDDVDYCIEQANDWKDSNGDFVNDEPNPDNNVDVYVREVTNTTTQEYVILEWINMECFDIVVPAENDEEAIAWADKEFASLTDVDEFALLHGDYTDNAIDTETARVVKEYVYPAGLVFKVEDK